MKCPWVNASLVNQAGPSEVYVVRFLDNPSIDEYAPFSGVCTVAVSGAVAKVYGLLGVIHRNHLIGFMRWAKDLGVTEVRATREPGHHLPKAVKGDDGWWVMGLDAFARAGR